MASVSAFSAAVRRLEGKVALITGGASGIGECAVKHFTKHGAKVMVADIQDEFGQSLCNNIGSSMASYIHCDVTKETHVQEAVDATIAQHGKLDIMFNNAGISGFTTDILDVPQAEFEQVLKVNLLGSFLGTKHAARVMVPAQRGSIISTASSCSILGGCPHAYTSSKHGIVGLAKNAAVDLGRFGIRVNCVSPYLVPTPMSRGFLNVDDEGINNMYSNLKGASLTVEDVAEAAVFLASDESKYISGHNLVVDGGYTNVNIGFCIFE